MIPITKKYLQLSCRVCKGEGKYWSVDEKGHNIQVYCHFCDGTGGTSLQLITGEEHEKYFRHSEVVEVEEQEGE